MGSRARSRERARSAKKADGESRRPNRSSALEENVQAIKRWERAILLTRSKAEQVSDWIACTAGSGPVLVLHVLWFGAWVTVNVGAIPGIEPFDPFSISLPDDDRVPRGYLPGPVCLGEPEPPLASGRQTQSSRSKSTCSRSER
jgi:hypothetical protein